MTSRLRVALALLTALMGYARAGAAELAEPSLLPRPALERAESGILTITSATKVDSAAGDAAASAAADEFIDLMRRTGAIALERGQGARSIRFVTDPQLAGQKPEFYRLHVTPSGVIITAADAAGLFYGGVSLWQLLTAAPGNGPVTLPARLVEDFPRFAWRGLMIDSARHFQSIAYLRHFIDWMALHKLNILHWHLTDDQGWRIEITQFPALTRFGPFYSQAQIKDLVAYAARRHVSILPEIEMPGHATAAIAAYPALGVAPVDITAPSPDWGVHHSLFNVEDSSFDVIEAILTEVMALFPNPYIHIGGDEAAKDQWKGSAQIQARMKSLGLANEDELQSYFISRIEKFLESHGRRLVGWDEILQGGIAPHATVMSWRGLEGAVAAARSGHDTVLSPWPLLYFDNRQGAGPSEPPGRGHIVSVHDVYDFDPMPADLTEDQRHHVIGVQANLWTEHMRREEFVTKMAFPRAAALAEIAWSPAGSRDWDGFSVRLAQQQQRYRRIGLADDEPVPHPADGRTYSQELQLCSDKLSLSVEDDAPEQGPRAVFLLDLMNPCWIDPKVDLTAMRRVTVNVGQLPFNFQLGADRESIHLLPPHSEAGELEVRADGCDGAPIASLALAQAAANPATTSLTASLPAMAGRHDLCFRFTGDKLDPLWAINFLTLDPIQERP